MRVLYGITGEGLGQGISKIFYLPEAHTDMIFAIVGEELGLIGCVSVLALFGLVFARGVRAAVNAPDSFVGPVNLGNPREMRGVAPFQARRAGRKDPTTRQVSQVARQAGLSPLPRNSKATPRRMRAKSSSSKLTKRLNRSPARKALDTPATSSRNVGWKIDTGVSRRISSSSWPVE